MKVDDFRDLLSGYRRVLVFRIDAPTRMLMSDERMEVAGVVHEMSARIENLAVESGFPLARGFAAGSCKIIFCPDETKCVVLAGEGECPFADRARPSISGVGVDFRELSRALGWQGGEIIGKENVDDVEMSFMAGIVLVD
jgi:predicted metal-binding protein